MKDAIFWLCVDNRKLNEKKNWDACPILRVDKCIELLEDIVAI